MEETICEADLLRVVNKSQSEQRGGLKHSHLIGRMRHTDICVLGNFTLEVSKHSHVESLEKDLVSRERGVRVNNRHRPTPHPGPHSNQTLKQETQDLAPNQASCHLSHECSCQQQDLMKAFTTLAEPNAFI